MRSFFPILVFFLLALTAQPTDAGRVKSSPRRQQSDNTKQILKIFERLAHEQKHTKLDQSHFQKCLQMLRRTQEPPEAIRSLLACVRLAKTKKKASLCLWEPSVRTLLLSSPAALQCLIIAGFQDQRIDRRGTPYLIKRRMSKVDLAVLEEMCIIELATVEREWESGNGARTSPYPLRADRSEDARPSVGHRPSDSISRKESVGGLRDENGDAASPPDDSEEGGGDVEAERKELLEQLQRMVTGLVGELERQFVQKDKDDESPSNTTDSSMEMPVHFRIYTSSSKPTSGFPFPPQLGLPFMPGSGSGEEEESEIANLERRLQAASLSVDATEVAQRELRRLKRMSPMAAEYSTLIDYLECMADLPWVAESAGKAAALGAAKEQLDLDHYGMEKVKKRVLEYLAVTKLRGDTKGSILCLAGPPGIGKTSLGKSIAASLDRPFQRVSLGGVHSEAEVRGHRRTYVGALPGLILQALKKAKASNPVILLDEVDKLGRHSHNGDPSAALLEVLDPEQNAHFRDHFLAVPFNLSRCVFIATANDIDAIPRPLRDRMDVIELTGYTIEEKVQIARRHLLPKQLDLHGLRREQILVDDESLDALVSGYTREAGVRELERKLAALCRAVALSIAEGQDPKGEPDAILETMPSNTVAEKRMGTAEIEDVLGPPKYDGPADVALRLSKPGVAVGLAWTPVGGDTLFVEAERMPGKGTVQMTGNIKEVMQESVKAAISWVRAHAADLNLAADAADAFLNQTDLHLHFPDGAVPKDGPSAGVTIVTSLASLLTSRLVKPDIAMTGEVTLRGLVLPVGGIKEKVIAAHRAGVRNVILPQRNEKDLRDLPKAILHEMNFIPVSDVFQVLEAALLPFDNLGGSFSQVLPVAGAAA